MQRVLADVAETIERCGIAAGRRWRPYPTTGRLAELLMPVE